MRHRINWETVGIGVAVVAMLATVLTAIVLPIMDKDEPAKHVELPDNLQIMTYDVADYAGEKGRLYVVRAEWVYLSAESAEEKMGELEWSK